MQQLYSNLEMYKKVDKFLRLYSKKALNLMAAMKHNDYFKNSG